jgi:gamma-glutamyltranspeptidase/glutathione hydrolase
MAGNGRPDPPYTVPLATPGTGSDAKVAAPSRGPVFGVRRAIAAEHPTASLTGMNVLQQGGNAVDAAIAASAVNVVVKPHWTHLGGDAFVLIWHRENGIVECLNAGGRASRNATSDRVAKGVPAHGALASTVPGLVDAWSELHARHGSRPLAELLAPAIELAERGFPVSQRLAGAMGMLAHGPPRIDDETTRRTFLADGMRPYEPGETFRQPELAETLRRIAADGRHGFYAGATGRAIVEAMRASGGLIDEDDLAQSLALWHEPLSTTYRGVTVYEQALPSQGFILLMALNLAEEFPLGDWGLGSADAVHAMVEATRLAFADSRRYAADPLVEAVPVVELLSKERARRRARSIDLRRAKQHEAAPVRSDTTSFAVADEDTVVSFIQSIFWPWGSGVTIPGTGVLMNNRMTGFSTDPQSPNRIASGKRTVHTLNTFLAVRDGELIAGGGTPGGDFQVQCNLQTIVGLVDWGLDLQAAIDAPRWVTVGRDVLALEDRFPAAVSDGLRARGHRVERLAAWDAAQSRSQVIASMPGGGWAAASDLRGEGVALAE